MKRMNKQETEAAKGRLLKVLTHHVGRGRMIGMAELYSQVFECGWENRINDTRQLRRIITALRKEGVPIVTVIRQSGGGYYLAAGSSEIKAYTQKLKTAALKKLKLAASIEKQSLPAMLGQMELDLRTPKAVS